MSTPFIVVVQCRYRSTRLPGKALYPLASLPMIAFLLRRLRESLPVSEYRVVLAVSTQPADDPIAEWGKTESVPVIRGEECDVLQRYLQCIEQFPARYYVRVTGDNPFTCPQIIREGCSALQSEELDYIQSHGGPLGAGVDGYSRLMLHHLWDYADRAGEREHINKYILDRCPSEFQTKLLPAREEMQRPDLRLTVDTREDYERIQAIINPNDEKPWLLPLCETIKRVDRLSL